MLGPLGSGSLAQPPLGRPELRGGARRPEKGELGHREDTGQGMWGVREEATSDVSILDKRDGIHAPED